MTDVVYVVGHATGWNDNELRFTLRSLARYVTGIGQVFIVGKIPAFVTNVVELRWPDNYGCKERNIMEKVAYACGHPRLSKQFLHVHDDHFALAPVDAGQVPNYAGWVDLGALAKSVGRGNPWKVSVQNTADALTSQGLTSWNFDIHTPIIFDKDQYPEIMDRYDWRGTDRGFVVKSLYANTLGLAPTMISDVKLNDRYELPVLVDKLRGRPWFSIGNGALSQRFKNFLSELYPKPSPWERV
jgi:hypothetical protein